MAALTEWLTSFKSYFLELGWQGVLLYALAILLVQLVAAPLSPMGLAAGVIFGFSRGYAALTLGTALGAFVNFLLSRYLLRAPMSRRLEGNLKFQLIDNAIGREGWKIVALLRFCPIPFGLANYCYGLTAIPLVPYLAATVFAIIPANAFMVWLGVSANEGLAAAAGTARPRHPLEYVFLGVGLIAAFFALRHISKVARQALEEKQPGILPPP